MLSQTNQQELFEVQSGTFKKEKSPGYSFLEEFRLVLKFDQLILFLIGIIVLGTFAFSLGMEKGKKLAVGLPSSIAVVETTRETESAKKTDVSIKKSELLPSQTDVEVLATPDARDFETPTADEIKIVIEDAPPVTAFSAETQSRGKYTIQMVTYFTQAAADKQIQKLEKKGLQGFVIPNGRYLQLCVNRFQSKKDARELLGKLKLEGIAPSDAYIRVVPA